MPKPPDTLKRTHNQNWTRPDGGSYREDGPAFYMND